MQTGHGMKVQLIRLITGQPESVPALPAPLLDDLPRLRECHGEILLAVNAETREPLGAIGVYPGRDEGGALYHLASLLRFAASPGDGIEDFLLEETGRYLRERRVARLLLGTSPLLTESAALYITRFGARYQWREGARTADGQPWPHVACECDFDDPIAKPFDLREDQVAERSVIDWTGGRPELRPHVSYTGPLSVLLPGLDGEKIGELGRRFPDFLPVLYAAFHTLKLHGYGFAWFDRLAGSAGTPGEPFFYYLMRRTMTL
jgi:hypothetical protein